MPSRPSFSIIVPCFNSGSVVDAALDSVRQQACNAEVIIVDGGSSDDTIARVRKHDDLVAHWVSEPDNGIYDAINKGLTYCRGDLIGVLGSDDRYMPSALEKILEASSDVVADIYAGATRMISADGTSELRPDEPYGAGALISGIPFGHNAMFATPAAYRKVGPYSIKYQLCADANWVHRAIRLGLRCHTIKDAVVAFALSGSSSTNAMEIMAETYDTIAVNFPGMNHDDAKALLYAVREWGPVDPVFRIFAAHKSDALLREAITSAFPGMDLEPPQGASGGRFLRRLLAHLGR